MLVTNVLTSIDPNTPTYTQLAVESAFPGELVVLKLALMASVFYGAVRTASLAWELGEIGVGLMAWLNIVAILILFFMGRPALKALKDYEAQRKAGVEKYTFDPEALGIKNADFWKK